MHFLIVTFISLNMAPNLMALDSSARRLKNEGEIKTFMESVLKDFLSGNIKGTFEQMAKHWEADRSALSQTEAKFSNSPFEGFGDGVGIERVAHCKVGSFFVESQYVVKFKNSFYFWTMKFYNPGDGWILRKFAIKPSGDFDPKTDVCRG